MRSSGAVAVVAVVVLLLLPLLYVGSVGPVVWLHDRGMMSPAVTQCAQTIYWPLEWATRASPLTERIMMGYLDFWRSAQPPATVATPAPAVPVSPSAPASPAASAPPQDADPALSTSSVCR